MSSLTVAVTENLGTGVRVQDRNPKRFQDRKMNNKAFKIANRIVRETAKAILVNCEIEAPLSSLNGGTRDIWFPKSQTVVDAEGVFCSAWILEQKDNEFGRLVTL